MTTESREESGTIVRYDQPTRSGKGETVATCDGCKELAARVERLEQLLASRAETESPPALGTTACYWICVGVHAFIALFMFSNGLLIQFGAMMCIGAVSTLVVCQVFSTRPFHLRSLRSLLSISVVGTSAIMGMWLGDVADPSDVFPFVVALLPPALASSWIVAKLFVWTRGWRIIAPGYTSCYPKLQIQHLLLCTLLVAGYLAVSRLFIDQLGDFIDEGITLTLVYLGVPTMVCTVITCGLARITFIKSGKKLVLGFLTLVGTASLLIISTYVAMLAVAGEMPLDWEVVVALSLYAIPVGSGIFASALGTFTMMRIANYRFARSDSNPEAPTMQSDATIPNQTSDSMVLV